MAGQARRVQRGLGFCTCGKRGSVETGGPWRKHAQQKASRGVSHIAVGALGGLLSSLSKGAGSHFFFKIEIVPVLKK